jgi:tetratricopeptide (TPR) repeat protein
MKNTDSENGVIPAKAGIQKLATLWNWIPVFTGMTTVFLTICFSSRIVFAAGTAENFLSHGPSVSAYGRGETGSAVFEDNSSVYYNPSLLAEANSNGVVLAEHTLFDGSAYSYLGINSLLNNSKGVIGASIINLKSGDVEIRQTIDDNPSTTNTNQWAYYLSYAKHIEKLAGFNYGVNLKYVNYNMYKYTGGGLGADIGFSKSFNGPVVFGNKSQMAAGLSILNAIRPSITLISDAESLGTIYRFGGAFSLPVFYRMVSHDTVSLFLDGVLQENMLTPSFGAEYTFVQKYVLRAGYFADNPTIGAGFKIKDFKVDYAIDFGDLAVINRFLVEYRWATGKAKVEVVRTAKPGKADNSLMQEAKLALRNNQIDSDKLDALVDPLFKKALKNYKDNCYLLAADQFREIMLKYPQYENSAFYYLKITDAMNEDSKLSLDSDFEKVSYAKGYVDYRGQKYSEAVNEWEKVLQMNPGRKELEDYDLKVKTYLKDMERIKKEKEIEARVSAIFDDGKTNFDAKKWIACIKTMEKAQAVCKTEPFSASFEWNAKAQGYIDNSIVELSKIAYAKPAKKSAVQAEKQPEPEIDVQGADKKYTEGLVLYAQGKTEDAIRMWEIAIRLNPNHEKAGKAIEKAKEELDLNKKK